jgi:hypothetical protein
MIGEHDLVTEPVKKMDSTAPVGYRWFCGCGRSGNGWHSTPEKAVEAGKAHT